MCSSDNSARVIMQVLEHQHSKNTFRRITMTNSQLQLAVSDSRRFVLEVSKMMEELKLRLSKHSANDDLPSTQPVFYWDKER